MAFFMVISNRKQVELTIIKHWYNDLPLASNDESVG